MVISVTNNKQLGGTQQAFLQALRRHGSWFPGCGWYWDSKSNTIRLAESLVKRGLVSKETRQVRGLEEVIYKPVSR